MASGIKVNLEEINKISKKYEPGSNIDELVSKCYGSIYTVKNYYKNYDSNTYNAQKKIINDIESSMRGINTNIYEVSGGLDAYYTKMIEGSVVYEEDDVFVANDQAGFEEQFTTINNAIMDFKTSCNNVAVKHVTLMDELSFSVSDVKESVEELLDKKEIKSLNKDFMSVIDDLVTSEDLELKVNQILNNYEHITDWYDRDYDASDHVKHVAGIAVQGAFDVVVATVAVSAGADVMMGAAIAAGASETLKAIKEYDDGATTDEAVSDGLRKFGVDLIFLLGAGEFEILSKQILESPQVKSFLIKYGISIESGVEGSMEGVHTSGSKKSTATINEKTKENIVQVKSDIVQGKIMDTSIEGLNEYFNDEYGLQLDEEQLRIMQGMVGVISEISV